MPLSDAEAEQQGLGKTLYGLHDVWRMVSVRHRSHQVPELLERYSMAGRQVGLCVRLGTAPDVLQTTAVIFVFSRVRVGCVLSLSCLRHAYAQKN